jgi:preprotein translocase subunit SecF
MARTRTRDTFANRLYRGDTSYPFISRRRRWYAASGIVILVSILSLAIRGLTPSIDFKGGAQFSFTRGDHTVAQTESAVAPIVTGAVVQYIGSGSDAQIQVQTPTITQKGPNNTASRIVDAISTKVGVPQNQISSTTFGATWGSQITDKAIIGLIVFLAFVSLYLSIRFEWKMALAAMIALLHDLIITAGVYSLSGFEVSPSTVIALLTILGYSLYDTVVVFDKVRENTAGLAGSNTMTFSEATNLAVNQTLVRSINTSAIALLPVLGLLVIGAGLLGAGSLDDLALALLIGLASGAYSSIFIASPLVTDFKEREPAYQQLAHRVANRRARTASAAKTATAGRGAGGPVAAVAGAGVDAGPAVAADGEPGAGTASGAARPVRPRPGTPPRRPGGRGRASKRKRR